MTEQKQPENALIINAGAGPQEAVPLGHDIHMSRDVSNLYRLLSPEGDVLINTGISYSAAENRRRLDAVSSRPIRKIILTQSHEDHIGGWHAFNAPGVETIVQANYAHVRGYWGGLRPTMTRRSRHLWNRDQTNTVVIQPDPEPTTTFIDAHAFELGGRRFELYSVHGGETLDSLIVWLPVERVVFTGNLFGPLFGHVPNLYTLRGDKIRYVQWYLDGVQRVLDHRPEMLVTGHGDPVRGAAEVERQLRRICAAVQYVKDRTFEGMNAGVDLWTLMGSITLPPELAIGQGHGKVSWMVRAIWEEHLGWFRYESTTELYHVPPKSVSHDLLELAGGAEPVLARARGHLAAGRPLQAMHLAEVVLAARAAAVAQQQGGVRPQHAAALDVKLQATELLLAQSSRENFSETRWLEAEIRHLKDAIASAGR